MAIRVHGFEIEGTLYEGPHRTIVRAVRKRDGTVVALKFSRTLSHSPAYAESIEREHELYLRLEGSVVPRPLELIDSGLGAVLVHELPHGESLASLLGQRLTPADAVAITLVLCVSLGALHDRRIIHNDLRPDGVWIDLSSGHASFLDLSSAVHPRQGAGVTPLLLGERDLLRIAPEQTGRTQQAVDHRTDLYAVGLILYQALHGGLPFESNDPLALVHAHLAVPSRTPSRGDRDIPEVLAKIALKLLAKHRAQRYQGAYGLAADLRACLAAMQRDVPLPRFVDLGAHDRSPCPSVPETLFGRDAAITSLRDAVERASSGAMEVVTVHGISGTGKTRLVESAVRSNHRARLAIGKLDAVVGNTPYGGVLNACRDLTHQRLAEPDESIATWKTALEQSLPEVGPVIAQLLPELSWLLGPQDPPSLLDPAENQYRLQQAFRSFIASIARTGPLVVFLDGLHWADAATLSLLQAFCDDGGIPGLVLIGSYRDGEVSADHPLTRQIDAIRQSGFPIRDIELRSLTLSDTTDLTAAMLAMSIDAARPLAQVVHDKTAGNPHFAIEFIRGLYAEAVLRFDSTIGEWHCDLHRAKERAATDNVLGLMSLRLQALSERAREVIFAAACFGSEFDEASVAGAVSFDPEAIEIELGRLVHLGLLIQLREAGGLAMSRRYRFVHDRVQEAAYRLCPAERRVRMHLAIGNHLLAEIETRHDEPLYVVVGHFNLSAVAIEDTEVLCKVARLNFAAGRQAMNAAAFEDAYAYFSTALRLSQGDPWETDYDVAFGATLERAQCAYLCSRSDEAEQGFAIALDRARTVLDKVNVHDAMALYLCYQDRSQRALEVVLSGLRLVGVRLSPSPGVFTLILSLLLSLFRMWRVEPRSVARLPAMTDPRRIAAMKLLRRIWTPASMLNRRTLMATHALAMLDLSLRYGNSPESPLAYATIGIVYAQLGLLDRGYALGRVARELAERAPDPNIQGKVLVIHAAFLAHIKESLHDSVKLLEQGLRLDLGRGDLLDGSQVLASIIALMPITGHSIATVHARAEQELQLGRRIRRGQSISNARVGMQWTNALGGLEIALEQPIDRDSRAHQEDENWQALLGELLNIQVGYLLGRPEDALASAQATLRRPEVIRLSGIFREFFSFYHALNLAVLLERGDAPRGSRRTLRKLAHHLAVGAKRCPENALHRSLLVAAELARLERRTSDAAELYDRAIEAAATSGFQHEEALAHELAGRFHLRMGALDRASRLLRAAHHGYEAWGARVKVERFVEEFASLVAEPARDPRARPWELQLDLASVIKASQAISGEIVLEGLLAKLMKIVLENAGAERGLLLLKREDAWMIEAEAIGDAVTITSSVPVEGDPRLCVAIIHYVARTGESVVLSDATTDGPFINDPYCVERSPKSVLVAPLFNQGKLIAILYLENNLAVGAFTTDRLSVVVLLLSQAALSIHNAMLYASLRVSNEQLAEYSRTLEHKVEDRTRELRQAQRQLITQEKLASLGTLTAGIAHELRNPLNFVTNFAELSNGLIEDLASHLGTAETSTNAVERPNVDETLDLLKLNTGKIAEHGHRANKIIEGMLLHSRSSGGKREPTDVNALLAESAAFACHAIRARDPGFRVELVCDYDDSVGHVELVPGDIRRVFVNVVSNACDALRERAKTAGPAFAPRLELRSRGRGQELELRVRDNGVGIPVEIIEQIYTPFFTTKPPGEGTGLGLSLSHDIVVDGHGGRIHVETKRGEFTEFVIVLPRQPGMSSDIGHPIAQ